MTDKIGVLFVCTGNICRSPSADGIFQVLVNNAGLEDAFHIDSAGLYAHENESPDRRSSLVAKKYGYNLAHIRGRQFSRQDFQDFDYLLAMDNSHATQMERMRPSVSKGDVHLFLDFAHQTQNGQDVPDPYYGGEQGFDNVFNLIHTACEALLTHLIKTHKLKQPA